MARPRGLAATLPSCWLCSRCSRQYAIADEHPYAAAEREAKEELGIDLRPGRLVVVDWVPSQPDGRPALANYLFDGGVLDEAQTDAMHTADGEIAKWEYCSREEYETRLPPHMVRRVDICLEALENGATEYLHNGFRTER